MNRGGLLLTCFAILHSPGGYHTQLRVDINQITAVRPLEEEHKPHVAKGSQSIIFAGGQKFAVEESLDQVQDAIHHCIDGDGK